MAQDVTLDALIDIGSAFGRVRLHQHKNKTWSAHIEFNTIAGVELEAKSGFEHKTARKAMVAALRNADLISKQFKSTSLPEIDLTLLER